MEQPPTQIYRLKVLQAIADAYPQAIQNAVLPKEEGQNLQAQLRRLQERGLIATEELTYLNGQHEIFTATTTEKGIAALKAGRT